MLAKNTELKVAGTAIDSVTSIAWGGRVWAEEDTTNHDDATPIKTTQVTVADNGKISIVISPYNKSNTQHAILRSLNISGASETYVMTQVDSGEVSTFSGLVTSFAYETPVTGILKAKIDIKVNGEFA